MTAAVPNLLTEIADDYGTPEGWLTRDGTADDHDGVTALWRDHAWRSNFGRRFRYDGGHVDFNARHRPRIEAALARSKVRIVCDAEAPHVFFGFTVVEGADLIHCAFVKRSFRQANVSGVILGALLGDMVKRRCFYTSELTDMTRPHDVRKEGEMSIPELWCFDPYSLAGAP